MTAVATYESDSAHRIPVEQPEPRVARDTLILYGDVTARDSDDSETDFTRDSLDGMVREIQSASTQPTTIPIMPSAGMRDYLLPITPPEPPENTTEERKLPYVLDRWHMRLAAKPSTYNSLGLPPDQLEQPVPILRPKNKIHDWRSSKKTRLRR